MTKPGRTTLLRALVVAAFAVGACLPYDPLADVVIARADLPAGAGHWLGTDHLGRDVLRRTVAGARAFLLPGVGAMVVALGLGLPLGAYAGWRGGLVGSAIRALGTGVEAIPGLVLVLLVLLVFGAGAGPLALAAGLTGAPVVLAAVADRLDSLRRAEFVLAARAHGLPDSRIFFHHLLWRGARADVGRALLAVLANVLVVEVTLSYLGTFGVPEPAASWGNMLAHALSSGATNPLAWAAPSAAVALAVWATLPREPEPAWPN